MNFHLTQSVFADGLLVFVCIRGVFQRRAANTSVKATRASASDRSLIALMVLGQVVVPAVYILSPWLNFANFEPHALSMWLGVLLWLGGLWLFWRSHSDVGTNWSVTLEIRESHRLITHGVYRFVRHPMYTSFFILAFAQALLLPNWVAGWSALVAVALLCIVRLPREESMMCEVFGESYRQYMRTTGALVPGRPSRVA